MERASLTLTLLGGALVLLGAMMGVIAPGATMPLIYAGIAVIAVSAVMIYGVLISGRD